MAAEEDAGLDGAVFEAAPTRRPSLAARKFRGRPRHGTGLGSARERASPRPGPARQPAPASRPSPTRPGPQSQSLSRSYGSNLPTSLTYISLSTRGCSPWRPAADMGTTRQETRRGPHLDFQGPRGRSGHRSNCGALRVPFHISLLEDSMEPERSYRKENSSRISRRRLQASLGCPDELSFEGPTHFRFHCRVPE